MILNSPIKNIHFEGTRRIVTVNILADVKPEVLPTTGKDIKGLKETDYLGPGSSIFTIHGDVIFLGESGWGSWL